MMARLRAKQPAARLAQADAVHLPFAAGLFDLVLTTHVMHLVAGWQAALREIRRVLRRGGLYISTGAVEAGTAPFAAVRDWWRDRVNALGAEWRRPGIESREELLGAARALGGSVETVEIEHLTESRFSLAELIDSLSRRVSSDTWNVPDAVLTQSVAETRAWAAQAYGDLDRRPPTDTRLVLDLISFDE